MVSSSPPGSRTISNSSLVLPRPPEDLPPTRGLFYDGFATTTKDGSSNKEPGAGLPDLNIGEAFQFSQT